MQYAVALTEVIKSMLVNILVYLAFDEYHRMTSQYLITYYNI